MKGLTLTQPWATLVAIGAKSIETRGWHTSYTGPVAIHAAKGFPADARALSKQPPFATALGMEPLPTAAIVAVATLELCWRFNASTQRDIRLRSSGGLLPEFEADFGDYSAGRCGFLLRDVRRLARPIPCRGMLSLWDVPPDALALIEIN